ncbi:MAG: GntR family transcriptional regulator [Clostridia bacterium]|nr:GntR family transcriptional regulator [Clostridia bacterium]
MGYNFSNDKPIFLQLADVIKSDIVSGKFKITEKLPSVRDFAFLYGVNPNTVQKALQILEDDGLIVTDRTNGKFVAGSTEKIEAQKSKTITQEIDLFIEKMKSLGLGLDEIKNLINNRGE